MGLSPFSRSSLQRVSGSLVRLSSSALPARASGASAAAVRVPSGNPNPWRYRILDDEMVNGHLILIVQYPDATNYEGRKVLMFDRGVTRDDLDRQGAIDPHFSPGLDPIHPIARFEPTVRGHQMARVLAAHMGST